MIRQCPYEAIQAKIIGHGSVGQFYGQTGVLLSGDTESRLVDQALVATADEAAATEERKVSKARNFENGWNSDIHQCRERPINTPPRAIVNRDVSWLLTQSKATTTRKSYKTNA